MVMVIGYKGRVDSLQPLADSLHISDTRFRSHVLLVVYEHIRLFPCMTKLLCLEVV